jgi:hypothetical protein
MSSSTIARVSIASYVLALSLAAFLSPLPALAQTPKAASGQPVQPGASCGFIAPCTRIGEIGLHIGALSSLRTDKDRSFLDVQGQARLSITFLDLGEVGTTFAGHIGRDRSGRFVAVSSPATVFARLRLLPLPFLRPLSEGFFRLALHAQHDFVDANFGMQEPPGIPRTTLHVVGGKTYGPIDMDGSVGFVLAPRGANPLQQSAFQLGLSASYWFRRAEQDRPSDKLRIQLEALYQFAQDPRFSTQGTLLAGLLGMSRNGFGGSFSVGPEYIDSYVGIRVMGGLQFSWGPHVRNPWAEKKAAEPKETPAWLWTLLGAIDPILREDGCVWTDPTPRQASYKWFCIGTKDPQNAGMILLENGQRLPVGTHLLEHGTVLRVNDGTKVAEIPLTARLRKAVLDYVDGLMAHDPDPRICDGRIDQVPPGMGDGLASVVGNDHEGGAAAVMGMHIYRKLLCDPEAQSSIEILSLLGKFGGRGPMRAKPNLEDRFAAPSGKPRPSGGSGGTAEHTQPALTPAGLRPLSDKAKAHILHGEKTPRGEAKGWHYEPSGKASHGTHVIESTRSPPDAHGVYEANVVIEGVKKNPRSTFFPKHWTQEQVEQAIAEAYQRRVPVQRGPAYRFEGRSTAGVEIVMDVDARGNIMTAYPKRTPGAHAP